MLNNTERTEKSSDTIPILVAGIFFMVQFYIFMNSFSFNGMAQLVFAGWFLLAIGFLLISLAKNSISNNEIKDDGEVWMSIQISSTRFGNRVLHHPFLVGWMLIVVGLAMISQYWLCIFCMGIQLPLIAYTIYTKNASSE